MGNPLDVCIDGKLPPPQKAGAATPTVSFWLGITAPASTPTDG
jgi:hypothetical protein